MTGFDETSVWWLTLDRMTPQLRRVSWDWLPRAERDRCARFRFDVDRDRCLLTRLLVRSALSRISDVRAREWCFGTGDHWRPRITAPEIRDPLDFNVSHAGRFVAVAVSPHIVGIDTEPLGNTGRIEEVSELVLTADELEATRALIGDERARRFVQLWTLKEAYLKALGVGLALSPKSFSFRWGEQGPELTSPHDEPTDRRCAPRGQGRASSARTWHFRLAMLGGENQLAVGVYAPRTPSVRIEEYVEPLCS